MGQCIVREQTLQRLQERRIAEENRIMEMEETTSALAAMSVSSSSGATKKKFKQGNSDVKPSGKFKC